MGHEFLQTSFLEQLFQYGLLIPSSAKGVYGRSGLFEDVVNRVEELITTIGRDSNTEVMRFPPVISRSIVEQTGYMKSFPQLLGSVHAFTGDFQQHTELVHAIEAHEDWGHQLSSTEVVMTPAACYPVYPLATGTLTEFGRLFDVCSYCFRHEPSDDPGRMQAFRQREYVRIADPVTIQAWREHWHQQSEEFLRSLGLQPLLVPANDPFFGPGGRLLAASQHEQDLKFELLAPVNSVEPKTAVISVNYHQDHFAQKFQIYTADGELAHTACIGFGLERITLALFRAHGFSVAEWPTEVYRKLWP